jgi:protein-L-isoaspartate(D-aspartate) O-methyltransferase
MKFLLYIFIICCISLTTCSNKPENRTSKRIKPMTIDNSKDKSEAFKLAKQLEHKGISDNLVLEAIASVPRHEFVDSNLREYAYLDRPLPIERSQTISQPYTVAYQSELLKLKPGEKVLEIGTGSGYQAAILCEMGAEVYSIERYEELHNSSKKTLNSLGYYPNLFYGDGFEGLPKLAPFDKILITAAPEKIPEKLLKQLKIGGWMVVPVGDRRVQKMTIIRRTGEDTFEESLHGDFIFVPMEKGTEK